MAVTDSFYEWLWSMCRVDALGCFRWPGGGTPGTALATKIAAIALVRSTTVISRTAKRLFRADKEEETAAHPLSERRR